MRSDQIIADVIAKMAGRALEIGYVKDISERIYENKQNGRDVSGVTLQRTPLGFHSPEVAEFVGRLVTVGLATQGSPVIITTEAIKWLEKLSKDVQDQEAR